MAALYTTTIFLSAFLLFSVQPMVGKLLLPLLGGAPAVWNTCMVFFQVALLLGYLYAHLLTKLPSMTVQVALHALVLLLLALMLPIGLHEGARELALTTEPSFALLLILLFAVAGPFFAVATSAPLLQRWFSFTRHEHAADPYFLYAASNAGSMLALLSYPFAIEPMLSLNAQRQAWAAVYLVLLGLIVVAGMIARHQNAYVPTSTNASANDRSAEPNSRRRIEWIALSFLPSSLLLSFTSYISTDIAAVPLLWVIPLALYLLTFIMVFAQRPFMPGRMTSGVLAFTSLPVIVALGIGATEPVWAVGALHLIAFFTASLLCHGKLAYLRPTPRHLTEYFLWISVGGLLGGIFTALIAPNLFNDILEYPLALILGTLAMTKSEHGLFRDKTWQFDVLFPFGMFALSLVFIALAAFIGGRYSSGQASLIVLLPVLLTFVLRRRPRCFAASLAAIFLATQWIPKVHGVSLLEHRNFFGVIRVSNSADGRFRQLVHGSTLHGKEFLDTSKTCEPLSYYHRDGPLGDVFKLMREDRGKLSVGVIGLGAGAMACYGTKKDSWTFYEINPAVVEIAENESYFRFLSEASPLAIAMKLGDARLVLADSEPETFDLLVLDAFSSDSVPAHLLTREALQLYLRALKPDGLLLFHISNRYIDLASVLAPLAADQGLTMLRRDDTEVPSEEKAQGRDVTDWAVLTANSTHSELLAQNSLWIQQISKQEASVWRDDYYNIVRHLKLLQRDS